MSSSSSVKRNRLPCFVVESLVLRLSAGSAGAVAAFMTARAAFTAFPSAAFDISPPRAPLFAAPSVCTRSTSLSLLVRFLLAGFTISVRCPVLFKRSAQRGYRASQLPDLVLGRTYGLLHTLFLFELRAFERVAQC